MIKAHKILFSIISPLVFINSYALEISINGSEDSTLVGNIVYDYQTSPSTISFQIDAPFVCTSINNSNPENILFTATDGNGLALTTLNNNIISTQYDLSTNTVNLNTDQSIQCASQGDTLLQDVLLFNSGFEDIELLPNDLELTLLDQSGNPFPVNVTLNNNDPFNYQYVVSNNGNIPLTADLAEYYKLDMNHPYFSGNSGAGNDWTCSIAMAGMNSTTSCGIFSTGNDFVNLKNAIVDPGEQLVIAISRTVEVPAGTSGETLPILAAAFSTVFSDLKFANNVAYKEFSTQ
jgi:hypothetical protein